MFKDKFRDASYQFFNHNFTEVSVQKQLLRKTELEVVTNVQKIVIQYTLSTGGT